MKKSEMHPERRAAVENYEAAFTAWEHASNGTDKAAFASSTVLLNEARSAAVAADLEFPSRKETARRERRLELSSRGLE